MPQEAVAQARAVAGPLDQPREVGDHEAPVAALHDSEHRAQGGEGVGADRRPRARNPAQQRRLAGVGKPDQPHVGEQLEREVQLPLLAAAPG